MSELGGGDDGGARLCCPAPHPIPRLRPLQGWRSASWCFDNAASSAENVSSESMGVVGKVGEAPAGALTTPLSSAEDMSSEFMGAVEAHGLVVRLSRMYLTKPLQDWRSASWRFGNTASSPK
jgi:hypothetical protein